MVLPLGKDGLRRVARIHRIANRDGWRCCYCTMPFVDEGEITEDHLVPQSRGGIRHISNLVLACPVCNLWKADMSEWELRRLPKFQQRLAAMQYRYSRI